MKSSNISSESFKSQERSKKKKKKKKIKAVRYIGKRDLTSPKPFISWP